MSPAARRTTLTLLAMVYGFGFADRVVIALVAQQLKAEFRISDLEIGLLGGTAFALINVIASLPLARLADRTSRKLVAVGSLLVGSLFTALCAASASFAQLLVLRLGMAAGSAGTEAPAHSLISDMYAPGRRASALSLFMLGVPLASIVGSALGAGVAEHFGWRVTFLIFGTCGLFVVAVALFAMREPPRHAPATPALPPQSAAGVIATMWGSHAFRHVMAGTGLVGLASFAINTFLPAFFVRSHGLGIGDAGLTFGLVSGVGSTIGSLAGGYGSERLARRNAGWLIGVPALGLLIGAPIMVMGVATTALPAAIVLILIGSSFSYMAMGPAIAILHGLLDPRSRATGSALFLMVVYVVGQGVGPPLGGFVSDTLAAMHYDAAGYARHCAGAAGQIVRSRCAAASGAGLRDAIACFALSWLWSGAHYALAARQLMRSGTLVAA